jgi:hypothetical protein
MHIETNGKTVSVLIDLYNKEIDTLKSKLLNGIPWEELLTTRENITNLAIAIHKTYDHKVSDNEDVITEIKKREKEAEVSM